MIDSHAHLYFEDYGGDPGAPLKRFLDAGGEAVVNVGTTVENSRWVREFSRTHPAVVFATAGIHPQETDKTTEGDWKAFETLVRQGGFVAVGETGLDYHRPPSTRRSRRPSSAARSPSPWSWTSPSWSTTGSPTRTRSP